MTLRRGGMSKDWTVGVLLVMALTAPGEAAAQGDRPPRLSIGAAAGAAVPFHADLDFTPWAWEADVRVPLSRAAMFEVTVGEWRWNQTIHTTDIRATPPGVIDELTRRTIRSGRSAQANILAVIPAGRVRLVAGGGVGLLVHHRRTMTTAEGCSGGAACGTFESVATRTDGSVQGVGGVTVRLSSLLAVYGQGRVLVPMRDPGASELRLTMGVRVQF